MRRRIATTLLWLLAIAATAQTTDERMATLEKALPILGTHIDKIEADSLMEKAKALDAAVSQENDTTLITTIAKCILGIAYRANGDMANAEVQFLKAYSQSIGVHERYVDHDFYLFYINMLLDLAGNYTMAYNFSQAEQYAKAAIEAVRLKYGDEANNLRAQALWLFATTCVGTEQLANALAPAREAVKTMKPTNEMEEIQHQTMKDLAKKVATALKIDSLTAKGIALSRKNVGDMDEAAIAYGMAKMPAVMNHITLGQTSPARRIAERLDSVCQQLDDHTLVLPMTLCLKARLCFLERDFATAEHYGKQACDMARKRSHRLKPEYPDAPNYLNIFEFMANLYAYRNNYQAMHPYATELAKAVKQLRGEQSQEYVLALVYQAQAEYGMSHLQESLETSKKADRLAQTIPTLNRQTRESIRGQIAYLEGYLNIGQQQPNDSGRFDVDDSDTYQVLCTKAMTAWQGGDQAQALALYRQARHMLEAQTYLDTNGYASVTSSIANLLGGQGDLYGADRELSEAIDLIERDYPNDHTALRTLLYHKGLVLMSLKNTVAARQCLVRVKALMEHEHTYNTDYALCLTTLAQVYSMQDDPVYAKLLNDAALDIYLKSFGGFEQLGNPDVLSSMATMAHTDFNLGYTEQAERTINIVIAQCSPERTGQLVYNAKHLLAQIHFRRHNYPEAVAIWRECLAVAELDPSIKANMMSMMVMTLNLTGSDEVGQELQNLNTQMRDMTCNIFRSFTESEREAFWDFASTRLFSVNNTIVTRYADNADVLRAAYDNNLFTRNMLMQSNQLLQRVVEQTGDAESLGQLHRYQHLKKRLADKSTPLDSIEQYRRQANDTERRLVNSIPDFDQRLKAGFYTWRQVRDALRPGEAAIELIETSDVDDLLNFRNNRFSALVLRPGDAQPRLVHLCQPLDLQQLLLAEQADTTRANALYDISDTRLYRLLVDPLQPYVGDCRRIYYSSSGLLCRVNFDMVSDGRRRMSDAYDLRLLSSTAAIVDQPASQMRQITARIYGGIYYNENFTAMNREAKKYQELPKDESPVVLNGAATDLALRDIVDRGAVVTLSGAEREARVIDSLLRRRNIKPQTLMKYEANEESFKAMSGQSPTIIHASTHGFFLASEKDKQKSRFFDELQTESKKDESMQLCGLLFAGSNHAWQTGRGYDGMEDGILTADELSRLDLSQTRLVVLSACETGLGTFDSVNGPFGLQRGLKNAGVGTIVMSLWRVPDKPTALLMTTFYDLLLRGVERHQALRQAQQAVAKRHPAPYNWAAFVMMD